MTSLCECCPHGFKREDIELGMVLLSLFLVLWLACAFGWVIRKCEIPFRGRES